MKKISLPFSGQPRSRLYWRSKNEGKGIFAVEQGVNREELEKRNKSKLKHCKRTLLISFIMVVFFSTVMSVTAYAADTSINVTVDGTEGNIGALEIIFLFAFISLIPSIVVMMTSFTRIVIVLSFLRNALGTQQAPPNMVITGLAIFLTLMIMSPTLGSLYTDAYLPFSKNEISSEEAMDAAGLHMKKFMLKQMNPKSLNTFVEIAKEPMPEIENPDSPVEYPLTVIVPAFITSELTKAFKMGFYIFLPFLVVDMVVASILMSMGMVMLPPAMVSLPFKILLFVLVDGWNLMITTLVDAFKQ